MPGTFTLDDFLRQIHHLREHGAISSAVPAEPDAGPSLADIERMIGAMTDDERRNPAGIGEKGKHRVAKAIGVSVQDVGRFLAQFKQLQRIMRRMGFFA